MPPGHLSLDVYCADSEHAGGIKHLRIPQEVLKNMAEERDAPTMSKCCPSIIITYQLLPIASLTYSTLLWMVVSNLSYNAVSQPVSVGALKFLRDRLLLS